MKTKNVLMISVAVFLTIALCATFIPAQAKSDVRITSVQLEKNSVAIQGTTTCARYVARASFVTKGLISRVTVSTVYVGGVCNGRAAFIIRLPIPEKVRQVIVNGVSYLRQF